MNNENNYPLPVTAIHILMLLNALIWLVLGILLATGLHPAPPESDFAQMMMAIMSIGTAAVMMGLVLFLQRRNRLAYWLTLALLAFLFIMTIVDQVGLVDVIVLVLHLVPFILLLKERGWYMQPVSGPKNHIAV
ncbi:MAG: hypothetical protein DWQ07_06740 [Chloroflexi bacterium]|nr:MAG: hypothetical protein DWQ07_06740 [Chloroflexota bacterium]MBL1195603.1 hypothetical protein [Chloroflexota bacterium]NOH12890.1 hypothetical protein [Chloroflexota bacterium]